MQFNYYTSFTGFNCLKIPKRYCLFRFFFNLLCTGFSNLEFNLKTTIKNLALKAVGKKRQNIVFKNKLLLTGNTNITQMQ